MSLSWCEEMKRAYSNGVSITYEKIDDENMYIHSITSIMKRNGNGTEALNNFLYEFKSKNIYIFSTSELGTDKAILDAWYKKLEFKETKNLPNIPYNVTHVKYGI